MPLYASLINHNYIGGNLKFITIKPLSSAKMYKIFSICICICAFLIALTRCASLPEDLQQAASGGDHHGRVQIKVFRGPTEHDGHHHFAPWGYWVKQPADHHH